MPSKRELRRPKTTRRTTATTPPDLNLEKERSRFDSFRLVSNRSIFLPLELLETEEKEEDEDEDDEDEDEDEDTAEGPVPFISSSFLEALSMVDRRLL